MIFLVSAKTPLCHKMMDDHILQSRHETKDAGELETFREEFVGLCWLVGSNCLINMLYLSYLMWCGSWEHDVMSVCSVFRLPFLLHVDYYLEFYFGRRLTILFLVLGLVPWVVFAGWSWYRMVYLYRECWQVQCPVRYCWTFDLTEGEYTVDRWWGRCLCSCAEGKKNNGVSSWLHLMYWAFMLLSGYITAIQPT